MVRNALTSCAVTLTVMWRYRKDVAEKFSEFPARKVFQGASIRLYLLLCGVCHCSESSRTLCYRMR